MEKLKLPRAKKRLNAIYNETLSLIEKDDIICDVGTDHGYLACLLAKNVKNKIIATDISAPSLKKAERLAEKYNVQIDARVGDGLLPAKEATIACMCGIGGVEIAEIIKKVNFCGKMVLQPVPTSYDLRKFLVENCYNITKDYVIEDGKKFYFIFAINGKCKTEYNQDEMLFGKDNIKTNSIDFIKYLKNQKNKLKFLENFDITTLNDKSKNEIQEKIDYYNRVKTLLKRGDIC